VVVNPATPAEVLAEILPEVDQVLVMTVHPGFGHRPFLATTRAKVRRVRGAAGRVAAAMQRLAAATQSDRSR